MKHGGARRPFFFVVIQTTSRTVGVDQFAMEAMTDLWMINMMT
jgi:hypothetical protein